MTKKKPEYVALGKYLKSCRLDYNYTLKDCGERVGVSLWTYAHYESGAQMIPLHRLIKLVDFILVDLEFVVKLMRKHGKR